MYSTLIVKHHTGSCWPYTDTCCYVFTLESKDYSIPSYMQHTVYHTLHTTILTICFQINAWCLHLIPHVIHIWCVFIAAWIQMCVPSVSCGIMITVHVWTCMLCADNLMVIKMWQSNTDPLSPEDVCTAHDAMGWCWILMSFVIIIVYVREQNIKGGICTWRLKIFGNAAQI